MEYGLLSGSSTWKMYGNKFYKITNVTKMLLFKKQNVTFLSLHGILSFEKTTIVPSKCYNNVTIVTNVTFMFYLKRSFILVIKKSHRSNLWLLAGIKWEIRCDKRYAS